ncbi:aspartate/glutamate racemase family protein [Nocardioides sp. R-C-SC26]|uniref:aspartate/glutamate racemase family protein n=1 Tax=Nocardioides sp. R-C-SC26 TaxID=2870414 RepID=UPI001E4BC459|nr:amino acid racemase [Nocardioides sp. R-C-SC26]
MLTIGLIGGMSWHSTMTYYQRLNERVAATRGGHASAQVALQSLDFDQIRSCQLDGDWTASGALLAQAGRRCVAGGADLVAICTNLMHKNFPDVERAVEVPVVHIADAVAAVAAREGWRTLGLMGARWVMEETFYAERLARHGIDVVVPDADERVEVDRVIFDELTRGRLVDSSRANYVRIMRRLGDAGADAVVLACTEIGLLVSTDQAPLPTIDSASAHADHLADLALGLTPLPRLTAA